MIYIHVQAKHGLKLEFPMSSGVSVLSPCYF